MKKILVAEDDQSILEVIKIILEGEGYSVVSTDDKDIFFKLVEEHKPSLILLDIWLSGHDGGKIAKQLKSDHENKHVPIIMISANNDTPMITKQAGADGFLLKPFDIDDLLDTVNKHIL